MTKAQWALGLVLWVLTVVGLASSHRDVGYVRDEGIYFLASRSYAAWVQKVAEDPGSLTKRKVRDRAFSVNHEHPALMKTVAGLSAATLRHATVQTRDEPAAPAGRFASMAEGAAMRLPAQILAGFAVALLFWAASRWTNSLGGLVAAGAFILLPRVWFNAGLHAFDVPVAAVILAVALAYLKALRSPAWGLALGPILGVAIAVKHNALFMGPLLALHLWSTLAWHRFGKGRRVPLVSALPLPLWSMAVLGPLTAWALWPWMWSDTWNRLLAYFAFHRQHNWYNMEFLGVNYNQPPMPPGYAAVMTWATVPTVLLVLAALGLVLSLRRDRAEADDEADEQATGSFLRPLPPGWSEHRGLWMALLGLFPLLLISSPTTPIFGGTKHWITAYPFFALAAAVAFHELWRRAGRWGPVWVRSASLVLVLGPAAIATADSHPYGLSQYAPLAGGPRGAAQLGLNRGFWGHAVVPMLPEVRRAAPGDGPLYLHDLHGLALRQYQREGRLPTELEPGSPRNSPAGLLFHERHMVSDEIELWNNFGTAAPTTITTLDDVPLTSLYEK